MQTSDKTVENVAQEKPKFRVELASKIHEGFNKAVTFRTNCGVSARLEYALSVWSKTPTASEELFFAAMGVDPKNSVDCLIKYKVISVSSLLHRILLPPSGKSWRLENTPEPEIPKRIEAAVYGIIMDDYFQLVNATAAIDPRQSQAMLAPEAIMGYVESRKEEADQARLSFARERAKKMDRKVDDIFREGGLGDILSEFVWNLCIFGTGVIIGPCDERVKVVKIKDEGDKKRDAEANVASAPYKLVSDKRMSFFCPQTCDVYPSKGAKKASDGFLYVKMSFEPSSLAEFAYGAEAKGRVHGWDQEAVRRVLEHYPLGGHDVSGQAMDLVMRTLNRDWAGGSEDSTAIEGVRCFGKFPGKYLLECGLDTTEDGEKIDKRLYYDIDAILMANELVFMRVCDPVIGRPVQKCTFYGTTTSWFGDGLADVLAPLQALATIAISGLKKQVQMTSSPERFVNDVDSFINSNLPGAFSPSPWKTYMRRTNPYQVPQAGTSSPISYIQMPHTISETLRVMDAITIMTDDYSGFPRNMFGSGNLAGAARTARGLAQIRESANIVADFVVSNIDKQVTSRLLKAVVRWLNVRGTDDSIKGDVAIVATGALGQALQTAKEETVVSALSVAGNGVFPQILGPKALLGMFRKYLEIVGYEGVEDIIGSKEKIEFQEALSQLQQMQQAQGAQIQNEQGQLNMAQQAAGIEPGQKPSSPSGNTGGAGMATTGGTPNIGGGVEARRGGA